MDFASMPVISPPPAPGTGSLPYPSSAPRPFVFRPMSITGAPALAMQRNSSDSASSPSSSSSSRPSSVAATPQSPTGSWIRRYQTLTLARYSTAYSNMIVCLSLSLSGCLSVACLLVLSVSSPGSCMPADAYLHTLQHLSSERLSAARITLADLTTRFAAHTLTQ